MEAIKIEDFLHYANLGKLKAKGQSLVWVKGLPDTGKKDKYLYTLETLKDGQVTPLSSFGQEKDFIFLDENTVCFAGNRTKEKGKSFIYQLSLAGGEAREIAALGGEDFAVDTGRCLHDLGLHADEYVDLAPLEQPLEQRADLVFRLPIDGREFQCEVQLLGVQGSDLYGDLFIAECGFAFPEAGHGFYHRSGRLEFGNKSSKNKSKRSGISPPE